MRRALGFVILAGIVYAGVTGGKSTHAPVAPSAPSATTYPAVRLTSPSSAVIREETAAGVLLSFPETPKPTAPALQLASTGPASEAVPAATIAPLPTAHALRAPVGPAAVVRRDGVRLRSAPGGRPLKGAPIRGGSKAVEIKRTRGWRQLELEDGRRGWVAAKALEAPETSPELVKPTLPEVQAPSIGSGLAVAAIAALIVQESRASYGGSCGCPDDRDRAGRRCGARSAYIRAGGRSLMCYVADVPAALISRHQAQR